MSGIILNPLETLIKDYTLIRYAELSAATIIIYEHLINLDEEVKLIWNRRWSPGKILFLLIRYYNILIVGFELSVLFNPNPSVKLCNVWVRWQFVTGIIVFVLTEIVLQARIYAMYERSKKILTLIVSTFLVSTTTASIFLGLDLRFGRQTVNTIVFIACVPSKTWNLSFVFWIPILCYETLLCALALYKGYQSLRKDVPKGWSGRKALDVLVRDSILYFFVIFATYFTNMLIWVLNSDLALLPVGFAVAMSTSMTLRLLFNIRRAFEASTIATADAPSTLIASDHRSREDRYCDTIELDDLTSVSNLTDRIA